MRSGLLVALLIVALLAAPLGAASSGGAPLADPTTTFTFALEEDGDANVSVTVEYPLDSANETEAFRDVESDFERGVGGPNVDVFERAASAASEATGRAMPLSDVERAGSIRNESSGSVGVLELSFQWGNFSTVDGGTLRVGDAYRTTDGTWLPSLRGDQQLRVVGPEGYRYADSGDGRVEGGALVWEGPTTFQSGDRQVVLAGGETPTPPDRPVGPNGSETPNGSGPDGPDGNGVIEQLASPMVGGPLVVLALGLVGLYAFAARRDEEPTAGTTGKAVGDGGAADSSSPDRAATGSLEDTPTADAVVEPDADETEGPVVEEGPFAGVDEDLLSDEERVERLLEYNGGRMKQANIVTETGWSNAKVSQLLSAMDENDRIDKLRIGRENLISLPDVDNGTGENGGS
ncbi:helix-turn-helix transcriptional regulator [Halomarina oriensis]|uniref:Helix-turn-helix domain-containing protein n=1 Tax=Halomarina oriensis TaxID=671145 RepID=A0A6B0GIE4_9EURY|nr:hypothetical protein [Halomarina oriensis]MWG34646.1 hypothetical protein [Halomarina oriensis]